MIPTLTSPRPNCSIFVSLWLRAVIVPQQISTMHELH